MTRTSRTIVLLAATAVFTLSGGPSALTFAGGDTGPGASGPGASGPGASGRGALDRAAAAALAATGGGRVIATEVDDEEGWIEIEVNLGDGRQVDVQLDRSFTVMSSAADEDTLENGN